MKFTFRRVLSLVLALVMVLGMFPSIAPHAHAATTKDFSGSTVADLGMSATDATGSGNQTDPVASWVASGANISGSLVGASGKGSGLLWRGYYYESTTTLTLTNNKTSEAELSFKYSATTNGSAYGDITVTTPDATYSHTSSVTDQEVSVTLAAGESVTVTLHAAARQVAFSMPEPNGASISISNIQLVGQGSVTVNFTEAENGSYTVTDAAGAAVTVPGSASAKSTDRFTMTATPNDGYSFSGWYNSTTGEYLSADLTYTTLFAEDATVTAKFIPTADGIYGVGEAVFTDLTVAAQAAEGGSVKTVVLLKDATLEGSHTIPAGVTLLIPYDANHILNTSEPETVDVNHADSTQANYEAYVKPSAFRTLTMASGSSITVNGAISVNGRHESGIGGHVYCGTVYKTYGAIYMNSGSAITLNNAANLYAWGYIWGDGTVTANSGATIYEKMQITDFRGGSNTSSIALRNMSSKNDGAFPFNQYYIQNVEVSEVLHEGAVLKAHAAVTMSGEIEAMAIDFIGTSSAMFMVTGATITKKYNPSTDRLSLSIDGDENSYAELNGMAISLGGISLNCANFTLPINSNIDININAGAAVVNQELVLQPGVKIFVDSDAALANNANIYVMDIDQWGAFVFQGKRQAPLVYSPSLNGGSSRTISSDAVVDINGYVMALAGLYTTAGGAQIISSEKTGMIEMSVAAPGDSTVAQLTDGTTVNNIAVTAAQLTNGAASKPFTATAGAAAGDLFFYCASCDTWHREADGCYVAAYEITWVVNGETITQEFEPNAVPSFSGETTKASDATNHYTFAGWATTENGTVLSSLPAVTGDATYYAVFTATAHADATTRDHKCDSCGYVMSECDDKDGDGDHLCDVCGAEDASSHVPNIENATCGADQVCTECKTVLNAATGNHTPNADDGDCTTAITCSVCGTVTTPAAAHVDGTDTDHDCDNCDVKNIEGHHGGTATCVALAVCEECGESYGAYGDHEYNQTAYTNITETHHTVSHICKYDATHIKNDDPVEHTYVDGVCVCKATKSYTITWVVEGVTTKTTVAHGTVPTAPAANKADTAEYDYTFSHWEDADGNTGIVAATADVTYTAVFTSVKQVYTITWTVEGESTTTSVAYGETPVYDGTPSKAEDAMYTYTFTGWTPAVSAVTGEAAYTAQFSSTAKSYNVNYYVDGELVHTETVAYGAAIPEYTYTAPEGYTFDGWESVPATMPAENVTVNGTTTIKSYTITWKNEDGSVIDTTTVEHGAVPTHADAVKEATAQYTYTFAGWTPEIAAATGEATYTANFTPVLRSYDITFVVDGKETKINTKYGETPVIADPTKETDAYYSYTFAGWTPEVVAVTGEATYTATWTETPVEHTITFVIDGETFHVEKGGYGTAVDTSDMPSTDKTGYTWNGWDAEIPATIPGEDIVITGSYTVNQYTITFKNDFNTEKDDAFADYTITKNYGDAITEDDVAALNAALPTITGWEFKGWYYAEEVKYEESEELVWKHTSEYEIPETMGAANVTVYAKWEENHYELTVKSSIDNAVISGSYMVYAESYENLDEFNDINGFCYDDSRVEEGFENLLPAGYTFAGYKYEDGTDVTFPYSHPAENVTIIAQFVPIDYTVTFMNGDRLYTTVTAAYGSAITAPAAPAKEGYVFAGWVDAEGKAASLTTMPLNGMTVYATWTVDSFKLNFFATEGDATAAATFDVVYGTELTAEYVAELLAQVAAPSKTGYTFSGWNTANLPATMPAEAVNVYGTWTVNSYLVIWTIDGEPYTTTSVAYGAAVTAPETPVKEGHTFSGWTGIPVTMPAENVTVTGSWTVNTYTITFDVEGIDSITAEYGADITWPEDPTKTGHWFMGWSTDGQNVITLPETMPADGLNLKAVWVRNSYWIYWNVEGEETGKEYWYGDVIEAPETPTKASDAKYTYKFVGWKNTSDEFVEFPVTVTENNTYYAAFEQDEKVQYTVKFVDGENTVYETKVAWDGQVTLDGFTAPTQDHYTLSWTVDGAEVTFPYAMDTKEVTFVANWTPVTYTIYFYASQADYNNGNVLHSITAAYGTEVAGYTYEAPEGWDFNGWRTDGNLSFAFPYTMGGEDVHLIALTSRKVYTATFVNGDWSRSYYVGYENSVSMSVNGSLDTPKDHDGYAFVGWFDENGVAYTDEYVMPAHNVTFTAKWTYTGWVEEANGTTYVVEDEKVYFGQWAEIDGVKYWFDSNSYIVKDITLIDGSFYAFDHSTGAFLGDYTGIYTASNGDLYYVENGIAAANKGLVKTVDADGHIHYYYFGCGMANCDCTGCTGEYIAQKGNTHWAEIDNGYLVKWDYTFDENGVVIHDEDTSKNGVHLDEGVKYYYIDGVKVHFGLFIGDDGEYYYARSNGSLVVDRTYWISESHLNGVERNGAPVEEGSYTFDAEGRIVWPTTVKTGIYAEDGSLYYYENGARTYAGLIRYTGNLVNADGTVTANVYAGDLIYVRTSGELAVSRSYWATKNNGVMASATYNFDEYGRMIRTNGFVEEDGGIYYYVNGSRYHAGLIMVNGDYYYVKTSGQVVTGCRYWITHTNGYDVAEGSYEFAADGKMILPEPEVLKNGIVEEDGKLWYYVDGKLNYAGLIQYTGTLTREDGTVVTYDNAWIYVRTSGELVVGRSYWTTKTNDAMKAATYQFDDNGIMLNPAV